MSICMYMREFNMRREIKDRKTSKIDQPTSIKKQRSVLFTTDVSEKSYRFIAKVFFIKGSKKAATTI